MSIALHTSRWISGSNAKNSILSAPCRPFRTLIWWLEAIDLQATRTTSALGFLTLFDTLLQAQKTKVFDFWTWCGNPEPRICDYELSIIMQQRLRYSPLWIEIGFAWFNIKVTFKFTRDMGRGSKSREETQLKAASRGGWAFFIHLSNPHLSSLLW